MEQIYKYSKTYHLEDSELDLQKKHKDKITFKNIAYCHVVVEEKMDVAINFSDTGKIL